MSNELVIEVKGNIDEIAFHRVSDKISQKLCRVPKPKLLWDPVVLSKKKCFPELINLFGKNTLITFDNTKILWNEATWPPSIDSLLFAQTLRKRSYLEKSVACVADIGCGTGFLGIYLAKNNRHIKNLYAVDIDPQALESATYNSKINLVQDRLRVIMGDCFEKIPADINLDLVVCNPPYIPTPYRNIELNSFAGTQLLEEVIKKSERYTKELLVLYSNLSANIVESIVPKTKKRTIVFKKRIPFRLPIVMGDRRWLEFLIKKGLIEKNDPYQFWHEIMIEDYVFQ